MKDRKLKVKEMFFSIQGEGARVGTTNVFIRLSGCNMNCEFCDTDWEGGQEYTLEEIEKYIAVFGCYNIIWTGGEPALQLDDDIVLWFTERGYFQAIETNGSVPVPDTIDYVSCSPKVDADLLNQNFSDEDIDEYRYPYDIDIPIPPSVSSIPKAKHYFVSPIFEGDGRKMKINGTNLLGSIEFVSTNPIWRVSVQVQKLLKIK